MRVTNTRRVGAWVLVAVMACGVGSAGAQDGTEVGTPGAEAAMPDLWTFCTSGSLLHDIPTPPSCPTPGSTTRVWNVECNPFCYTTTHLHGHTATGYCLDIAEEVPYTPPIWIHCGYVPPYQLITLGNRFRTKGADGYGYMWLPAGGYNCTLTYFVVTSFCSNCDVDIWECLNDPLILSTEDSQYELTDTKNGVQFDLNGDGDPEQIPWVAGDDDAFLVLDRNGNGLIDDGRELFSHVSPQQPSLSPNGFLALRMFDELLNGGNGDGKLNSSDRIYESLRLWLDADRDGSTDAGELVPLSSFGLAEIGLDYTDEFGYDDEHGNTFKYSAPAHFDDGRSVLAWAVFFNIEECTAEP